MPVPLRLLIAQPFGKIKGVIGVMQHFIRRRLRLVILLCLSMALLALTGAGAAQSADMLARTAVASNVRSGPGVEWRLLGTAAAGTTVRLDGQAYSGNWVRGITSGGLVGWFFTNNLNISQDQAAGLRSIWVEVPFTLTAPAQEGGTGGGGITLTTTADVNQRVGPGTQWRLLGTVTAGTPFAADGRDFSGTWVHGVAAGGQCGWIFGQYVSGNFSGLPVVAQDAPCGAAPSGPAAPPEAPAAPDAPSAPPVTNTAPTSGFNLGGHVSNMNETTFNWMRTARMTWIKKQVRWSPGMDPGGYAGMINTAHGSGFRILLGVVGYANQVNNGGYFEEYARFVGGLAALGADGIEVWNEPNIDREWQNGSIDPARYTELLRQAYHAIKGANSNTLVISGAPAPTGFFGGCHGGGCDDNHFVAGMARAGAANYMDCIGIHYNEGIVPPNWTSGDPRGNSSHYTRYYPTMVSTYYNAFGGRRPLCFTELGYLTPEGYGPLPAGFQWAGNVTLGQQVSWLSQVVSMARSSGRVRLLIIWNVDFANYGDDPMAGYAMIRPGGDCPACRALGGG
jgi:uncharacterized protein YraI